MLPAVADLLHEQAMLVADAVAVGRDRERRHAVHVAGGEPAQAAVAQRRVGLELAKLVEIDVEAGERRAGRSQHAQVDQRIEQQASDQEFDGEVVHPLAVLALGPLLGFQPSVDHAVADRKDGGDIPVVRAGIRRRGAARIGQLVEDSSAQLRCVRMKRRQREDLRRLWHFPTGIGVDAPEKSNSRLAATMARFHSKARSMSNFKCLISSRQAPIPLPTALQCQIRLSCST